MAVNDDLVLITGASGGIGLALTESLLKSGRRNLVCQYRTHVDQLGELLARYDLDPSARAVRADLVVEDQVIAMRDQIVGAFGAPYGLVNLAGASTNRMSWKMSMREFQSIVDANLLTTFLTCREMIPGMRERNGGRIINISSVTAFTGAAGASHYCAAKAAIVGFSKAIAQELAPKKVVVSAIALGYFQYGLIHSIPEAMQNEIRAKIPAARFGEGDELGGLVGYLLSEAGAYAGGQVFHLNGGLYS
jgi:NAD(P)-dependent dehydrogenase (short-subunit alcohol dehydrogenase family)